MQKLFKQVFLCILFFSSANCFSQEASPKTLLWRISGKNLQQPSYLFGTMHLNDKRLFRFDDSVYQAIEKSQGFAIEVSPDEMAAYEVNKMFDNLENAKKLKDVMDEKSYNKYSKALAKKFKKPVTEITTNDVVKEKHKWVSEYMQKGEMPTFVDAYLYNIARKQGKWVGGIEDITDQSGLLNELVDVSDIEEIVSNDSKDAEENVIEHMIALYTAQDIDGINAMTGGYDSSRRDVLLTKRNIKMARRMDSLSSFRTMFFAIGAAHLPGDGGVISLLKKSGFTVEPVLSKKKIESKNYKFKELPLLQWVKVEDEQQFYNVLMPGNPASVKLFSVLEMKFLLDISSFSAYCTMAVVGTANFVNKDSIYNEMAKRIFKSKKAPHSVKLNKNGIDGVEFNELTSSGKIRLQLFNKNKITYMAMMYSLKKETMLTGDADKFFESFTINEIQIKKDNEYNFTDSFLAINFHTPIKLSYNEKLSKQSTDSTSTGFAYVGVDANTGAYLLFMASEAHSGYFYPNDTVMLEGISSRMKSQYDNISFVDTNMMGYKTCILSGNNISNPAFDMRIESVVRGNKKISLMLICDTASMHSNKYENIFRSFNLLPYKKIKWSFQDAPDQSFGYWSPSTIINYKPHTKTDIQSFISFDTASTTTFSITTDTLGKYIWAVNDSVFWKKRADDYISANDTLIFESSSSSGSDLIKEYHTKVKNGETIKRIKFVLHGNILYSISTSGDKKFLRSEDVNKLYSSFSVKTKANSFSLKNSKAELLLTDLLSRDSSTRHDAFSALRDANFEKNNATILQQALFRKYTSPYQDTISNIINNTIANKLFGLHDSSTIVFVKKEYDSLKADKEYLRNTALSLVSGIYTKESYDVFMQLLQQYPLHEELSYSINSNLNDSLSLTSSISPSLLHFAKDSILGLTVASITNTLIDSGFIKVADLKNNENDFIHLSAQLLPLVKNSNDYDYKIQELIELLGKINTVESIHAVKKYLAVSDIFLKKSALLALIDKKQTVDTASINAVAANPATCSVFYYDLVKMKKESLFPVKYLTQKNFAAAAIYSIANEDGDKISVKYLAEKKATVKGKKYKFLLYKLSYNEGEENAYSYLAIAGGYDIPSKLIEPVDDFTRIVFEAEFDEKLMNEQFNNCIKELEEGGKDNEVD